jgi:4-amino-4-deoxy-L-arabinose transferase-like glycosyltransferase
MSLITNLSAPRRDRSLLESGMAIVWVIALLKLVLHTYFNSRYGYFRDEFNYLSSGDHLGWGYVDQPPLIPFLARVGRVLFGDSLRAIRFIPALASSLLVVQAAALAREFGGGRFALVLTALCVAVAPQYLSNASLLGTNALEPTLWMGCAYLAVLAIKREEPRYWMWFGVIAGIGLEEKYTIALFGAGIVAGLLLTAQRRVLRDKWIWLGGLAAFAIFIPNLWWNYANDWPFLQLMHAIRANGRDVVLSAPDYFVQQMLLTGPLTAPIWLSGLLALLFSARLKPYRFLGWAYLVCYGVLFALHGKSYYLAPVYPLLLAAGACVIERWIDGREHGSPRRGWLKAAVALVVSAGGVYLAPIVVPVLSPEQFIAYTHTLPFKLPVMEHSHARATLPQWYSDQFGWKEIADATAVAWNRIPAEQRADCGVFAQDYGQAGAIDFFGRAQGLPSALSGDRTYFLWGPRTYSGNCMIVLDDRKEVLQKYWENVELVATSSANEWALETDIPVFICTTKKFSSWAEVWPSLKHWH